MNFSATINKTHQEAKGNKWLHYFAIFLRLALAFGFFTSGMVKIVGERFAAGLSDDHPMGHYLEALHHTGFYYTFIGCSQVLAAILLLFRRTVLLGVLIYFPIILNICILSYAVRFEGSIVTSPLMVLGCLYLLFWNYDKIKYLLPFDVADVPRSIPKQNLINKFPTRFFVVGAAMVLAIVLFARFGFDVMPRNSYKDCMSQFAGTNRTKAGEEFCDCIHKQGQPLDTCLKNYHNTPDDTAK